MIEGLFVLLRDPDYRVRFFLARRVGVLFQTWDGHEELFQDIWYVILINLLYQVDPCCPTLWFPLGGPPGEGFCVISTS